MTEHLLRVFFAIDFTDLLKKSIGTKMKALSERLQGSELRWTNPEKLHITVQYLGQVRKQDISLILEKVKMHISGFQSFEASLGAMKPFPYKGRARNLAIQVFPLETLQSLSQAIGKGIQESGYEIEKRAFLPHATLARFKGKSIKKIEEINAFANITFIVKSIVLFSSESVEGENIYRKLEELSLGE